MNRKNLLSEVNKGRYRKTRGVQMVRKISENKIQSECEAWLILVLKERWQSSALTECWWKVKFPSMKIEHQVNWVENGKEIVK